MDPLSMSKGAHYTPSYSIDYIVGGICNKKDCPEALNTGYLVKEQYVKVLQKKR